MEIDFNQSPFGLPSYFDWANDVNVILSQSVEFQKQFKVSNSCLYVSITLKRCFDALGINNEIVYGVTECEEGFRVPHVWVEIEGNIIENTYQEDRSTSEFISSAISNAYKKEDPTIGDVFLGDEDTRALNIPDHDFVGFKHFLKNHDKFLLSMEIFPYFGYYKAMARLIKHRFRATVRKINNDLRNNCWVCNKNCTQSCSKCSV